MHQPPKVFAELRPIYVLAAIVIFVAGLKSATTIVTPLLLAIFIAVISGQPVIWLQKKGVPKDRFHFIRCYRIDRPAERVGRTGRFLIGKFF